MKKIGSRRLIAFGCLTGIGRSVLSRSLSRSITNLAVTRTLTWRNRWSMARFRATPAVLACEPPRSNGTGACRTPTKLYRQIRFIGRERDKAREGSLHCPRRGITGLLIFGRFNGTDYRLAWIGHASTRAIPARLAPDFLPLSFTFCKTGRRERARYAYTTPRMFRVISLHFDGMRRKFFNIF